MLTQNMPWRMCARTHSGIIPVTKRFQSQWNAFMYIYYLYEILRVNSTYRWCLPDPPWRRWHPAPWIQPAYPRFWTNPVYPIGFQRNSIFHSISTNVLLRLRWRLWHITCRLIAQLIQSSLQRTAPLLGEEYEGVCWNTKILFGKYQGCS